MRWTKEETKSWPKVLQWVSLMVGLKIMDGNKRGLFEPDGGALPPPAAPALFEEGPFPFDRAARGNNGAFVSQHPTDGRLASQQYFPWLHSRMASFPDAVLPVKSLASGDEL